MAMLIQKMTLLKSPGSFKSRAFMAEEEDMGLEEVKTTFLSQALTEPV
jgi:hypothetical protein